MYIVVRQCSVPNNARPSARYRTKIGVGGQKLDLARPAGRVTFREGRTLTKNCKKCFNFGRMTTFKDDKIFKSEKCGRTTFGQGGQHLRVAHPVSGHSFWRVWNTGARQVRTPGKSTNSGHQSTPVALWRGEFIAKLKADWPHLHNYLHTPSDYRHTNTLDW